jgi:hypothetical protein
MTSGFPSICMNWTVYDVPAIWAMVSPEREWVSREQTSAWLRTSQMLDAHQSNLQLLRDRVAEHWAPEGSPASQILIKQLDSLIHSVTSASDASRTNASALSLLTDALMETRAKVQPLYEAWGAATTESRKTELNQQAWTVMSQGDSRVIEHASQLTVPPDYSPPRKDDPGTPMSAGMQERAPMDARPANIPPLTEPPTQRGDSWPGSLGSNGGDAGPTGRSAAEADKAAGWSANPILAASGTPRVDQERGSASRSSDPPAPPRIASSGLPQAVSVGGLLNPPSSPSHPAGAGMSSSRVTSPEFERFTPSSVDGVIGGRPPAGTRRVEQSNPTERMEGGLLGGGLGLGAGRSQQPGGQRRYPADEEWAMPSGVEPVLKPGPEPDPKTAFDPGPNVIGLHR